MQQDNSNMQIQSPGTKTGLHHGEAITENERRRISLCVEIGFVGVRYGLSVRGLWLVAVVSL